MGFMGYAMGGTIWGYSYSAEEDWIQIRAADRLNPGLGTTPETDPEVEWISTSETLAGWQVNLANKDTGGSGQDSFMYDFGNIVNFFPDFVNDGSWGLEFRLTPVDAAPGTTAKCYFGIAVSEDTLGGLNSGFLGASLGDNGSDAWVMRAQRYGNTAITACPASAGGRTLRALWWPGGDPTAGSGANFGHITVGSETPAGSIDCMAEYVGAGTNIASYKLIVYGGCATNTNNGPHALGRIKLEARAKNLRPT